MSVEPYDPLLAPDELDRIKADLKRRRSSAPFLPARARISAVL